MYHFETTLYRQNVLSQMFCNLNLYSYSSADFLDPYNKYCSDNCINLITFAILNFFCYTWSKKSFLLWNIKNTKDGNSWTCRKNVGHVIYNLSYFHLPITVPISHFFNFLCYFWIDYLSAGNSGSWSSSRLNSLWWPL